LTTGDFKFAPTAYLGTIYFMMRINFSSDVTIGATGAYLFHSHFSAGRETSTGGHAQELSADTVRSF
jgi:hypothetical protein